MDEKKTTTKPFLNELFLLFGVVFAVKVFFRFISFLLLGVSNPNLPYELFFNIPFLLERLHLGAIKTLTKEN